MDKKKNRSSTKSHNDDTITLHRWQVYTALMPVLFLVGLVAGYFVWGWHGGQLAKTAAKLANPAQSKSSTLVPTPKAVRYDVPAGDAPALGPANAKVTVIEFSDFECPFCRKWQQEVYPQLIAAYGDKIRFVYRNFPLSGHASAIPAAEASLCANEQGKYWEYHDKLFSMELPLETASYQQYASDLGLDTAKFNTCLSTHRYLAKIQADVDFATKLGVDQTPTFFIDGLAVLGAQPFSFFQQVIDQELAGQIP